MADFTGFVAEIVAGSPLRWRDASRKDVTMTVAQPGLSITNPEAYRENLFKRGGDRNPLDVLSQTASTLSDIVRAHPASVLRARPFEGKWTPNEIIGHLADGEWVSGFRLRLVLCEENPTILGMNQELWVAGLRHNDREPAELVEMFHALRELNL